MFYAKDVKNNKIIEILEDFMSKTRTNIDEDELLCVCIEGGLATSTPEFIQTLIDKYNGKGDVRTLSVVKRLSNIKEDLLRKQKNESK